MESEWYCVKRVLSRVRRLRERFLNSFGEEESSENVLWRRCERIRNVNSASLIEQGLLSHSFRVRDSIFVNSFQSSSEPFLWKLRCSSKIKSASDLEEVSFGAFSISGFDCFVLKFSNIAFSSSVLGMNFSDRF